MERGIALLEEFSSKYNLNLKSIPTHNDFLIETIKLSQIALRGEKTSEFYDKTTILLDYVLRTKDSDLALIVTETLLKIQKYSNLYLTDHATNIRQLICIFDIQFTRNKSKIYFYTLKILNNCNGSFGDGNIRSILIKDIPKIDSNIYECFNLRLILELLHTYMILDDSDAFNTLYKDILIDWEKYDIQLEERFFEKLLWYGFISNNSDEMMKKTLGTYPQIIESNIKGVRHYFDLMKELTKEDGIKKFIELIKKIDTLSKFEKKYIIDKVNKRNYRTVVTENRDKPIAEKGNYVVKVIKRLSPEVKIERLSEKVLVKLNVFEDRSSAKLLKTITVELLTDKKKKDFYATKKTIKKINENVSPGYLPIKIEKKKKKKKSQVNKIENFKWPSTEISPSSIKNDIGLSEKSELRKMGYQITNTTRSERWLVLERAVPKLGLRSVAYTIAANVKLRKGQKNGLTKYRFAITEWEHDLNKLKQKYYRSNFPWPKT